jgi:NDP-sugar pyrophosphorylase family protein
MFTVAAGDLPNVPFLAHIARKGKPMIISSGIYLIEPKVHGLNPHFAPLDMTDLIQLVLREGRPVSSVPIRDGWLETGSHDDDLRVQKVAKG